MAVACWQQCSFVCAGDQGTDLAENQLFVSCFLISTTGLVFIHISPSKATVLGKKQEYIAASREQD